MAVLGTVDTFKTIGLPVSIKELTVANSFIQNRYADIYNR
jgi:hypothetical protein